MTKLEKIVISPTVWPNRELEVQPGDLSKFAPYGTGVYGFQSKPLVPIKSDPPHEPSAGIVYFGNDVRQTDFGAFLRMMDIRAEAKDYAVFVQESSNPVEDRYFKQMRFVSKFGLEYLFHAINGSEYGAFKDQELPVGDALWEFIESEKERFGTNFGDPRIEGKMGGDGHFAREQLSFGFMLENEYHRVFRIWSRAWLVTK